MLEHDPDCASLSEGLPVAPSLGLSLHLEELSRSRTLLGRRALFLSGLAVMVAVAMEVLAQGLVLLIGLITNLAFTGACWEMLSLLQITPWAPT